MEGGDDELMDLPPGFRFHPTDEEIITNYLIQKVMNTSFTAKAIAEVDLNKCEPWDLPKKAKMGEKEYFFFCKRDRKYPTGMRTNRATESGYWKATGKDKEIFKGKGNLVGMKKTLVFYKGRAPKGEKTNWVMHEFRLEGKFSYYSLPKTKEEWVVSKVFHKMAPKRNSIGELIRIDSFVDHLLDNPSLPALMEMNSADENLFNDSSSPTFNNQKGKMAQYQPYNNNANINYYQASSSNTSAPNPAFYPRHTYQNTEFTNQNQETRPGNFPGFNSGPGNFPGYDSGPGFMQMSNQTISQTAIRRDCKMEQFSTNNSMVSHSQDTGLSTDFGPPEISSMVSRPDDNFGPEKAFDNNEDLEYLSSGTNIAELDSFWDY